MSGPGHTDGQRTGDDAVDAAIDAFVARGWVFSEPDWEAEQGAACEADPRLVEQLRADELIWPLDDFRRREHADGMCHVLAWQFAEFCRRRGLDAFSSEEMYGEAVAPPATHWNYAELTDERTGNHTVTLINRDTLLWAVDFTAAQYGADEFPLCQRADWRDPDQPQLWTDEHGHAVALSVHRL